MKEFEKIIGYASIKRELAQIADIFKNRDVYDNLGVKIPAGVLLHGVPGVGKSLMATALIEASGLKYFICRKDKPNGDFVKYIKETFDKAVSEAPSIVFLDDMDKFANGDEKHPDCEEYVAVQSCIDESKNKGVSVVATANNIECLPKSLLRVGRFDRIIKITVPDFEDSEKIIMHYLSNKKIASDFDFKLVAKIMHNHSCAELETVVNQAGIYAAFEGADRISMEHFLKASLIVIYNVPLSAFEDHAAFEIADEDVVNVAYHEAGHALVQEILEPGSISFVSLYESRYRDLGGLTTFQHGKNVALYKRNEIEIIAGLAGRAAVEQKFGICDTGCTNDLEDVFEKVYDMVVRDCKLGFHFRGCFFNDSDSLKERQENAIADEVTKYYSKAKEIISSNIEFFDSIAAELLNKKILFSNDIKRIRNNLKN